MKINGTEFNLEFCAQFPAEKLRKIYSGESAETLDKLTEAVYHSEAGEAKKNNKKK